MKLFYFFKVTLSYFDDERETIFITPEQSETDEKGVPFSENDLRSTPEFKAFVKRTRADIIDVDYTEYAAEFDTKKSEIFNNPITEENFAELEKIGLEIVDENQFLILLTSKMSKSKSAKSGGSRVHIACLIGAAALVLVLLMASAGKKNVPADSSSDTSDNSEFSEEISEEISEDLSAEISEENSDISDLVDISEDASSEESSEISDVSSEESESSESAENSGESSGDESSESGENTHEASE